MSGLIGKKIGMTSIYDASGKNIPCTIIEAGPCVVTQIRTKEIDGYEAVQLAYDEKKEKSLHELEKVDVKLNEADIILKERGNYLKELKY